MAHHSLRIGEVAEHAGVTVEALRYYERLGLLVRPPRTSGGVRRYGRDVLDRVRFIKQAQTLGLTLREIQQLTRDPIRQSESGCRRVRGVLSRHITEIDQRIAELRTLRRTLTGYLHTCDEALGREHEPECPTLEALEK